MNYFLGVDVGTSSVRVGLFNQNGELINQKTENITIFNFKPGFYEQSSSEIIEKIVQCIKEIFKINQVADKVVSVGFDATCSLVVLNENYDPLSVSPSGDDNINIIMWMDHRAVEQAKFINSTEYEGLNNVGGSISPEMDPPKILWLKQNLPSCYIKASQFFSLPDFLVWKFTGKNIRSVCSTTCKWLYKSEVDRKEWDQDFWKMIGLEELVDCNFEKIGSQVEKPFKYCDELKLSRTISDLTGLPTEVKIGVSMIDAHAGGIGGICLTYGYFGDSKNFQFNIEDILVLVSGTSSCFMASSKTPKFINGIWGPYYEAMVPNLWLNEGGQSASGKLLDHFITTHPSFDELKSKSMNYASYYDYLNEFLKEMATNNKINVSCLTKNIHVYPDFHGNRSPLGDSEMKGQIIGLDFDTSLENLALLYLAAVQAIVYQTRQIIEKMNSHEINFKIISLIGGLVQNKLYCQMVCDVCNLPVLVQNKMNSSVILGSAILGSSNFEDFKDFSFENIIRHFSKSNKDALNCSLLNPDQSMQQFHNQKYLVFKQMIENQKQFRSLMENF